MSTQSLDALGPLPKVTEYDSAYYRAKTDFEAFLIELRSKHGITYIQVHSLLLAEAQYIADTWMRYERDAATTKVATEGGDTK